ncbi:VOC family protein [Granulosicoccaceae sp. 1_MG-2023]|nr:VOC family protein [Granulosicoccaceae sp. 1_MG-2023]
MSILGIDHINIKAPAELLDEARDFYARVLDLQAGERPAMNDHGYWLYAGKQALIHLNAREFQSHGASYYNHVAFRCRDPQAYIARLEREGVSADIRSDGNGRVRQIFFYDPFDLRVELNFPPEQD